MCLQVMKIKKQELKLYKIHQMYLCSHIGRFLVNYRQIIIMKNNAMFATANKKVQIRTFAPNIPS